MTLKIGKLKYNYFLNKALLKSGNVTHVNVLYAGFFCLPVSFGEYI